MACIVVHVSSGQAGRLSLRVLHPHQKQALWRRRHSADAAILGGQDFQRPVWRVVPLADLHQRAGDVADHIVQKAVGLDLRFDIGVARLPPGQEFGQGSGFPILEIGSGDIDGRPHEMANRAVDVKEQEDRLRAEIERGSSLSKVLKLKKWEKVVG